MAAFKKGVEDEALNMVHGAGGAKEVRKLKSQREAAERDKKMMAAELRSTRDLLHTMLPAGSDGTSGGVASAVLGGGGLLDDSRRCVICLDEDKEIMFEPCRHVSTCRICAETVHACPVCRVACEDKVQLFL
jgi:hypothetical protein